MATVLKGRDKGKTVRIEQWANDWIMADGKIYRPTMLELSDKEYNLIHDNPCGIFNEYYCDPVGSTKGPLYRFGRRAVGC